MDIDTTVTIGLGLPETGVDLAKLIFSVAQECDSSKSMNFSIDLSSLADEIMLELKILRVQHENPHLSEAEIQQLMNEITAENQRKKEILAAEKAVVFPKGKGAIPVIAEKSCFTLIYRSPAAGTGADRLPTVHGKEA